VSVALIVDDNDGNRKLARDLLGSAGFRTLEAATGADAFALATEHMPDVVLMDLRLPDIDGAEAARRLRDDERTAAIPIVALSALSLEGNDDWLMAVGFAGWLEKPIHVATFAEQVRGYCSGATR
jgi:two-component system, cell cycle response regulator DivK